ncbi:hypothetical protein JCM10450v2_003519 [Rhodotorula kratochvilovae]
MSSLEDFDRQVKALTSKGKLSSSLLQGVVDAAMRNITSDSHLVSTLYRYHKKAAAANKLTSLYLVDGIAREARTRQKKLDRDAKGKARESPATPAVGSTTPTGSPPPVDSPAPTTAAAPATGGTYATFLKTLEGMLPKFVLDNWENGLPEHREKVRKVLDIWTKAATFSASSLARVSQKLLATSTASTAAQPASPVRPSLSPAPISPPRDATPSAGGSSTPSTIPANVLALLQASSQAPPSQAAIEQKRQEELQNEVERVLREAQMGAKGAPYGGAPPPAAPAPSYSAPPPSTYSHAAPPPLASSSSYTHAAAPSAQPAPAFDPAQLAALQQIAGGLNAPPPPQQQPQVHTPQYPSQQHQQQQRPPPPPQQHSSSWREDEWSAGPSSSAAGANGGFGARPPQQQQHPQAQQAGYDGPRGQTRSYDEAHRAGAGAGAGAGGYGGAQRDEPPAKRAYVPPPPQQPQPQSQSQLRGPPMQEQVQVQSPLPAQPTAGPTPTPTPSAPAAPLDPTAFDATSPASWASFVGLLRNAHPYFAALGRPPSMEEVMSLCAPSAMMAFGAGAGGGAGMGGMGMGGADGQGGALEGAEGYGANGGY